MTPIQKTIRSLTLAIKTLELTLGNDIDDKVLEMAQIDVANAATLIFSMQAARRSVPVVPAEEGAE